MTTTEKPRVDRDYLRLIRKFPLRPLRSDKEHAEAAKILGRLVGRVDAPRTPGETDYMLALAQFVEEYDQRVNPFPIANLSPSDVLKALMQEAGMNASELARTLNISQPLASAVVNAKRGISRAMVFKLADHFKVNPILFMKRPAHSVPRSRRSPLQTPDPTAKTHRKSPALRPFLAGNAGAGKREI